MASYSAGLAIVNELEMCSTLVAGHFPYIYPDYPNNTMERFITRMKEKFDDKTYKGKETFFLDLFDPTPSVRHRPPLRGYRVCDFGHVVLTIDCRQKQTIDALKTIGFTDAGATFNSKNSTKCHLMYCVVADLLANLAKYGDDGKLIETQVEIEKEKAA